jgi:hypothetical protein
VIYVNKESVEQIERLQGLQYGQEAMKWYGWGSPIGLSIFFLAIVAMAAILKVTFFA